MSFTEVEGPQKTAIGRSVEAGRFALASLTFIFWLHIGFQLRRLK
jgi:hypothetical protein